MIFTLTTAYYNTTNNYQSCIKKALSQYFSVKIYFKNLVVSNSVANVKDKLAKEIRGPAFSQPIFFCIALIHNKSYLNTL